MPSGSASVANAASGLSQEQRNVLFRQLVNEAVLRQGINHSEAISQVQTLHPDLCPPTRVSKAPSKEELSVHENRRYQIGRLVNEMMERGCGDYDLCYNVVRAEHPELFSGMQEPETRR
jgi:hypothetical protein